MTIPLPARIVPAFLLALSVLLLPPATSKGAAQEPESAKKAGDEKPPEDAGKDVFDPAGVLRIRIDLSPEAVQSLRENPKVFVRGTVHQGGKSWSDVGVRLKGSIGSFRPFDDKPGLTLKFNQFIPGQRFHGLKKLLLNNGVQDSSYLCELLGNELFRGAGVPAPRIGHALVVVNGRRLGLYVAAEAVTRDFLGRWFEDARGPLWEGPGDIESDRLDVDSRAAAAEGEGHSPKALRRLIEACKEPDLKRRLERMGEVLDLDRFVSFLAMEALLGHWDGYAGNRNNFHLYHDPARDRMVFIPHGTDQLFQNPMAPIPIPPKGTAARAAMKTSAGRKRYRERLKELADVVLDPARVQERIDRLEEKIRSALSELGPGALLSHALAVRTLRYRVGERGRGIRQMLEGKIRPPQPGPPLAFDATGKARLRSWQTRIMGGSPVFERVADGERGGPALKVTIGDGVECRASWRKTIYLEPGRYRFQARIRTQDVSPARGLLIDGGASGADVRISGDQPRQKLLGTQGWTSYGYEFEIEADEDWEGEPLRTEVVLVCELQAAGGTAWFDESSLEILKLAPGAPGQAPPVARDEEPLPGGGRTRSGAPQAGAK